MDRELNSFRVDNTSYVFLVGMMCSGKSTIGRLLADKLKYQYLDTDRWIQRIFPMDDFRKLFREDRQLFHSYEKQAMAQAIKNRNCVISTGGKTFTSFANKMFITVKGVSVFIDTKPKVILERLNAEELKKRVLPRFRLPLWLTVRILYYWRLKDYNEADIIVDGNQTPEKVAEDIAAALEKWKNDSMETRQKMQLRWTE